MIRAVRDTDIPVCLDWYNYYIENTTVTFEEALLSEQEFASRVKRITEQYTWLMLEENGKPVGYAYLDHFNARNAYRYTADVAVYLDPEETGKGYGRALMKALEAAAKHQNIHKLVSLVTEGNLPSEKLHESLGYRKTVRLEHVGYKFGRWLGVSWYEKDILPFEDDPGKVFETEGDTQ